MRWPPMGRYPGSSRACGSSSLLRCQAMICFSNSFTCRSSSLRCWVKPIDQLPEGAGQLVAGIFEQFRYSLGHVADALRE